MDFIVKVAFGFLIFITTWLFQEQVQEWDLQRMYLKSANNKAVHDAAFEFDELEKSRGRLVFRNDGSPFETYKTTLAMNLGLDDRLMPKSGSRLRSEVTVVHFELIDQTTVTFPYLYDNPTYRIAKYLHGPAVVAVVRVEHPSFFNNAFPQSPITVPTIYEYKPNK